MVARGEAKGEQAQGLQLLDDQLGETMAAIRGARRSSRLAGILAGREVLGVALVVAIVCAALSSLVNVHPIPVGLGVFAIGLVGWVVTIVGFSHRFEPSTDAGAALYLAYSKVERTLAEVNRRLASRERLGWGSAKPSEWSYERQLSSLAELRSVLAQRRRALVA